MIQVLASTERGHANHGWLDSYHTFSFADYFDPKRMGFRALRVINEDYVEPGQGFGTHGHKDMEIITYVLEGAVQHQDSLGSKEVLRPGEVQRMTAGTGVRHSEVNPSGDEKLHLLQIWILPEKPGLPPGYEQREFPMGERRGKLRLVASRDAREGSLTVHQDVNVYAGVLGKGEEVSYVNPEGRHAWIQVARGELELNGRHLSAGDGVAVSGSERLSLRGSEAGQPGELLLFDLA
jgi:quercetin 2,3-dioxygenase